jgi:hypothetical protein
MPGRRSAAAAAVVALLVGLAACSNDDEAASTTTAPAVSAAPGECPVTEQPPLAVDQIEPAVAAVAADDAGLSEFFEINATPALVNLFAAGTDTTGASTATPYSFSTGVLSGQPATPATGNTFAADALQFDPQRVLSCVIGQLPGSSLTAFVVEGGPAGAVRYSVVVGSEQGGQLVVEVSGTGQVLSVDPV